MTCRNWREIEVFGLGDRIKGLASVYQFQCKCGYRGPFHQEVAPAGVSNAMRRRHEARVGSMEEV